MTQQLTSETRPKSQGLLLVEISATPQHVAILYRLLTAREHRISHTHMPTFDEHRLFVQSHPYRAWYLIKRGARYIGSVYFTHLNSIGIFVMPSAKNYLTAALKLALAKHRPLPSIKSVRTDSFDFNISPNDAYLAAALEEIGAKCVQVTYSLKK